MIGTGPPPLHAAPLAADDLRLVRDARARRDRDLRRHGRSHGAQARCRRSTAWPSSSCCRRAAVIGRRAPDLSDDEFRAAMRGRRREAQPRPRRRRVWDGFARRLLYVAGAFSDDAGYRRLGRAPAPKDRDRGTRGNRLFYLATAARVLPGRSPRASAESGWPTRTSRRGRFARLVVEKPFGHDLASARELNARLSAVFRERQVYRIDHYLGKETVQNLLVLRFANAIFEPIWNRRTSTTCRSPWPRTSASGPRRLLRRERARCATSCRTTCSSCSRSSRWSRRRASRAATCATRRSRCCARSRPSTTEDVRATPCAASTAPAWIARRARPRLPRGGRRRPGVQHRDLRRPCALIVDNWRWAGMPFYLRTGKRLPRARHGDRDPVQAGPAPAVRRRPRVETIQPNLLVLRIQPDEGTSLRFLARSRGRSSTCAR